MTTPPQRLSGLRHPARVRAARDALLTDKAVSLLSHIRAVLCEETRTKIVRALSAAELTVGDLAHVIGRSESSTSQHLRALRRLGIVRSRRRGRSVYNSLADAPAATAAS